jgi:hypothetical protein
MSNGRIIEKMVNKLEDKIKLLPEGDTKLKSWVNTVRKYMKEKYVNLNVGQQTYALNYIINEIQERLLRSEGKYEFLEDNDLENITNYSIFFDLVNNVKDEDSHLVNNIVKYASILEDDPENEKNKSELIYYYKKLRNKYDSKHINIKNGLKNEKIEVEEEDYNPVNTTDIRQALKLRLDPDDIEEYGLSKDIEEVYRDLEGEEDEKIDEITSREREIHNFKNQEYNEKQLKKTFERFLLSYSTEKTFISKIDRCDYQTILKYLCFIKDNPDIALPTLLWLDTFHDFKEERLMASVEVEESSRRKEKLELNQIIDYICYRIYGGHWAGLNKRGKIKDCVDIGYEYTFDKMYQNSFFKFQNLTPAPVVTGFHEDVKHTVLKPLIEKQFLEVEVAKLLYDVSNVFISNSDGWESDFLYMYMLYNFEFNIGDNTRDKFLDDLRKISNYSISRKDIPYYAKDVDKASSHYLKGDLVVLPASIFDANPSNSSKSPGSFVSIPKTTIPYCNGYNFIYNFTGDVEPCKLTLEYGDGTTSYAVCSPTCNINNDLKDINIKELSKLMNSIDIYSHTKKDEIQNEIIKLNRSIKTVYFVDNCVKLPDKQGMSPVDIISIIIGLFEVEETRKRKKDTELVFKNQNKDHPLSPISCRVLDFWVALKRIGDFGQIMQCKQLGIPLFTNDNMQILISMAACSSVVFTIDNSKAIWYNGFKDAFMKNELSREYLCDYATDDCIIKRIERTDIFTDLNKIDTIEDILMNLANKEKDFEAISKGGSLLLKTYEELDKERKDSRPKSSDTLYYASKKDDKKREKYMGRIKGIESFIQTQKNKVYKGVINELLNRYNEYDIKCETCSEASTNLKEERGVIKDIHNIREHNCNLSISIPTLSSTGKNPRKKQKVYEVEKIKGNIVENGERLYEVKWKGYLDSENTWEPETSFDKDNKILEDYKADNNIMEE